MKKSDESNPIDELAEEGLKALKAGDFDGAIARFKRALRQAPFRDDIKELLARALDEKPFTTEPEKVAAESDSEETDAEEAEEAEPVAPPSHRPAPRGGIKIGVWLLIFCVLCLSSVAFFLFFSSAIQNFVSNLASPQNEVQLSPADREAAALFQTADLLQDQRRYSEAIDAIQKALEKNPTNQKQFEDKLAELYFDEAEALYKKDDYPKAIASYEKAVEHNPDSIEYHYGLGWANYILGRKNQNKRQRAQGYYEKARQSFLKILEREPENLRAKNALAQVYIALNDVAKAAELYRQIIHQDPESREAERARRALQSMGLKQ